MSPNFLPSHTPEEVAKILSYIPAQPDHDTWIKICAAVCSEIGDEDGLQVLLDWSPDYGNKKTETVVRSFRGNYKADIGALINLATQGGFNNSEFQRERKKAFVAPSSEKHCEVRHPPKPPKKHKPILAPVALGECSICQNAYTPEITYSGSIMESLEFIKSGMWKEQVNAIRQGGSNKTTLPFICAYGVYKGCRRDENLISRSGFIVLDYDEKDNVGVDFTKLKFSLSRLSFTLAAFTSPRGKGLKAVIRVPDDLNDSEAFKLAKKVLAPFGGTLDDSAAARRHFFASYDEDAFINPCKLESIPELPKSLSELTSEDISSIYAEIIEKFAFKGKDTYFYDEGTYYKELGKADAIEEITIRHGIDRKTAPVILCEVRRSRYVQQVYPSLTCHRKGIHILEGERILVLSSAEYIKPKQGDFTYIKQALETIFRGEVFQLWYFLSWLQHAYSSFVLAVNSNGEQVSPVPLLMLLGNAGAGKDLLFSALIRPILGGRKHAGADTFFQEKPWLGSIIGSECVLASEMPRLTSMERDKFKSTIKQVIGGSGYFAESKGKNGFMFRGQHFICLLANIDDGGNCASACPAIDEDFKDKFIALSITNSNEVKALFPGEKTHENSKRIRNEIPAFLYWLTKHFKRPNKYKDDRFGVRGYCSPDAFAALFEVSQAATLKEQLVYCADRCSEIYDKFLTAAEIYAKLSIYFKTPPSLPTLGRNMRTLSKEEPETFVFNGNQKHPKYKLLKSPEQQSKEHDRIKEELEKRSPFEHFILPTHCKG